MNASNKAVIRRFGPPLHWRPLLGLVADMGSIKEIEFYRDATRRPPKAAAIS